MEKDRAPCPEHIKEPSEAARGLAAPRCQNPREKAGLSTWSTGRMGQSITDLKQILSKRKKDILERVT